LFDNRITGPYNALTGTTGSWRMLLQEEFEVGRAAIHGICLPKSIGCIYDRRRADNSERIPMDGSSRGRDRRHYHSECPTSSVFPFSSLLRNGHQKGLPDAQYQSSALNSNKYIPKSKSDANRTVDTLPRLSIYSASYGRRSGTLRRHICH
jgi:hypothetical protein